MKKLLFIISAIVLTACRGNDPVLTPDTYDLGAPRDASTFAADEPRGFFLLNQGNMGSNKATIDYGDFVTGKYLRNIFPSRNPSVVKELGDVGNDLQIYGDRLYAVINASHKVEVMDLEAHRIGQIDIPNCRYMVFSGGKGYVSSFVGGIGDADSPHGAVYEFDIQSLEVTRSVSVGFQPEQMALMGNSIYIVNSGGYRGYDNPDNYERTVSVIDLASFAVVRTIDVGAVNLLRIAADEQEQLWILSQGDYVNTTSTLLVAKPPYDNFENLNIRCSNFAMHGDKLYYYDGNAKTYGIISTTSHSVINTSFITDGTDKTIDMPYLITANPSTGEVMIGDAKNYVSSGTLSCYTPQGTLRWRVTTGDIPAALAWVKTE